MFLKSRIIKLLLSIGFLVLPIFGQTANPITQSEYVQMLYDLERNPSRRSEIILEIRIRGIAFEVTGGLRTLTASKSKGDAELRRTLDEAGRRRANPNQANLPDSEEVAQLLNKARTEALDSIGQMPDFVVRQQIQRSAAYAGTNNFRNLDRLVVAVSYRSSGFEEYRLISLNGVLQTDSTPKRSYEELGGTSSTGEFVTVLSTIFKEENLTLFEALDTDVLRGRRTIVFRYKVDKEFAKQSIFASGASAVTGMTGRVWIDRESHRVLKIESEATEIPPDFPVSSAMRTIDYDWVDIAGLKYLLPSVSDVRLIFSEGRQKVETRNLIRFRDYQKFGSEIRILDDEEDVEI